MSGSDPGTGEQITEATGNATARKAEWRRRLLAERRLATPERRRAAEDALSLLVAGLVRPSRGTTVTAYVPARNEPGSVETLEILVRHRVRVLLPVIVPGPAAPLRWARFRGVSDLTPGPFGIAQPSGLVEPTEAALDAAWMAIPALAVDRTGVRLGRGGGHYDRTLEALGRTERIVAVVNDHEFVERLPAEPHDIHVTHVITPSTGLHRLAGSPEPTTGE